MLFRTISESDQVFLFHETLNFFLSADLVLYPCTKLSTGNISLGAPFLPLLRNCNFYFTSLGWILPSQYRLTEANNFME